MPAPLIVRSTWDNDVKRPGVREHPGHGHHLTGGDDVPKATAEERFWAKVDKTTTCWLWTGCHNSNGYGRFRINGQTIQAHRFAYELLVGPIPEGLTLDHVKANGCTSTLCVKAIADEHGPAHLESVTQLENNRRGASIQRTRERYAARTHCKRGHVLDAANTRFFGPDGRWRDCRACRRRRNQHRREMRRPEINAYKRAWWAARKKTP